MTYEMVIQALENIHPGSFFRISYKTELPLKAAFSKQGYKIYRLCQSTVRTGINYGNIRFVIEERSQRPESSSSHKSNIVPVIKNKVYKNSETDQLYLRIYPTKKGTNKISQYVVVNPDGMMTMVSQLDPENKGMVRDSYFTGKYSPISMIKLENLYRVGSLGVMDE